MKRSRYYAWAALDVENWSGRPAVNEANIQNALRGLEKRALAGAGIDLARVSGRQSRGDGAILALPGDVAKELITAQFVEALRESLLEHDADCDPADSIRMRLSLHAGDVLEGEGEWAGQPVIAVSRLVDSAVIKRVLAAAAPSPLALIVSGAWYDAVVREGHVSDQGYREVRFCEKTFIGSAWVKVPGRTCPPGLLHEDDPRQYREAPSPARPAASVPTAGYVDNSVNRGAAAARGRAGRARPGPARRGFGRRAAGDHLHADHHLWEALCRAYDRLGFGQATGAMRCSGSSCWHGSSSPRASRTRCECWRRPLDAN